LKNTTKSVENDASIKVAVMPALEYEIASAARPHPIEFPIRILVDSPIPEGIIKIKFVKLEIPIDALNSTSDSHPE